MAGPFCRGDVVLREPVLKGPDGCRAGWHRVAGVLVEGTPGGRNQLVGRSQLGHKVRNHLLLVVYCHQLLHLGELLLTDPGPILRK